MTTVTESDLKELKDFLTLQFNKIEARFDKIEVRFDRLEGEVNGIRVDLATVKGEVTGINKRIDDLNTGLNTFTIGFLSIVGILVTGILGIFGKVVFFPNP